MADRAAAGPLRKAHFRHQLGLDPVRPPYAAGLARKRTGLDRQRVELAAQVEQDVLVEAAAHIARIAQLAVPIIRAQQQRADAAARALRVGIAADHEFLAVTALELDPLLAAARRVGRAAPLADHAFQAQLAGSGQQLLWRSVQLGGKTHQRRVRQLFQQLLQQRAARFHWLATQVVAVEIRHVEQVIHDLAGGFLVERQLQRAEIGLAIGTIDDDFAVIPAWRQLHFFQRLVQLGQLAGPVVAVAGNQGDLLAGAARQDAVAVEFQFEDPVFRVAGRVLDQRGQLRRQGVWQGGFGRLCLHLLRSRLALRHGLVLDAVGQFVDHRVFERRARVLVLFLDQQPGRLFFALAFHAHQHPVAVHFMAVQSKFQVAGCQRLARVRRGRLRLPGALVPDNHLAGAILLFRNGALEARIRDRVILDLHRHALVLAVVAGAFRHGPAFHGAVEFQPEIVMQAAGPVFLDDEGQLLAFGFVAAGRLGRDGEIALGLIGLQSVFHGGPML